MSSLSFFCFRSSPKQHRRSPRPVPMGDDDSEDETGKLTQRPNSKVPTVDGIDNHDEFTRYTRFRMIQFSACLQTLYFLFKVRRACA